MQLRLSNSPVSASLVLDCKCMPPHPVSVEQGHNGMRYWDQTQILGLARQALRPPSCLACSPCPLFLKCGGFLFVFNKFFFSVCFFIRENLSILQRSQERSSQQHWLLAYCDRSASVVLSQGQREWATSTASLTCHPSPPSYHIFFHTWQLGALFKGEVKGR